MGQFFVAFSEHLNFKARVHSPFKISILILEVELGSYISVLVFVSCPISQDVTQAEKKNVVSIYVAEKMHKMTSI